jgi:DMSO/TMAO reductase YedYZ molybdopterin-dependent catalytic subunit
VISKTRGAIAGLVAGAVALAVGELVAGIGASRNAPVIAVGNSVIDAVPRPVKDFAIETFGTNDKVALLVGIYTVIALIAIALGVASTRRWTTGAVGIGAFGMVGLVAVVQQGTEVSIAELLAPILGAVAGIVTLWLLLRPRTEEASASDSADLDRRRFLTMTAGAVGVAAIAGSLGRFLQSRVSATASRLAVVLPRPMRAAASIPAGADLGIEDLSPFITPNGNFYRIDVNLVVPQVEAESWRLKVHGRVDKEIELTFDDVLGRDMVEEDITLACVSNEIGGRLVGNARWLGTPLLPLLEEAGIDPSADQVIARAVDGFTVGFPVEALRDGRAALLAIGMNGEPLPHEYGGPVRLVVPFLQGYKSVKWLGAVHAYPRDPVGIKRMLGQSKTGRLGQAWVDRLGIVPAAGRPGDPA